MVLEFPLAPVEKILKRTKMSVSKEAVKEFAGLLEEITSDIAAEAAAIALAQKKKTVSLEDVREAVKKINLKA